MDWLVAIGTGFVGKVAEYTVAPVGRQVGYLIHYNRNLKTLESQLGDLDAVRQSVERKVGEEKRNIREAEAHVNKWLTDVQKITGEANDILKEDNKAKMKCLNGFCPNLMLRHQLSRKSTKLVPDIVELYGKKDFNTFAHATTPQDVPAKDYEALGSRTLVVKQIMDVLRNNPNTNMIGVYGLGGVGKTTLVKEVSRQATEDKTLFDDVAMVLDVKKNPSIERIQKEIAEKLDLDLPGDGTPAERARRLFSRIKDQKTLVILDDVWEIIDLEAVGLAGVATCKVLLTSRTGEVLYREMHTQKEFPLEVLKEAETWSLFEKMAGDVIKDPAIRTVATEVAKRCGGLPVMVVTVASALKNSRKLHAWNDALRRLKKFDKEEFTEKTYLALEWSYSQLKNEELKSLFLLCGFYATRFNTIHILYLLKYGIGLGLFKNLDTMGEAWDALNSRLEKLKDACLLLDHEKSGCVKMHDFVHDVAKRISSRDQPILKVTTRDELKEWPENKEFREKCTMISLQTSNIPKLPEVLQCKELKLFYVNTRNENKSLEIPSNVFKETTKLRVLDLSGLSIPSLPPSLQFLKNLKTLCLDGCTLGDIALVSQLEKLEMLSFLDSKFKELPKEIGQLTRLRSLDLTGCSQLEVISPNVISRLNRLEELRMGNSFNRWQAAEGVISTERNNASLSELKRLPKLSVLLIHILDASILPTNLFSNALERYQIYIGAAWTWRGADATLNTLKLKLTTSNELDQSGVTQLLKRTDELFLDGTEAGKNNVYQLDGEGFQQLKHLHVQNAEFGHIINGKGVFPNLTRLVVSDIEDLRSLLSSSMARSLLHLTHLQISRCPNLEDIVSTKVSDDEENMENMFSKLQHLQLESLPNLTKFWSRSCMEFPSLERHHLDNKNEIEEMDSKENLDDTIEHCLFDKKGVFPNLTRLVVSDIEDLRSLLSSSMARSLVQLTHLQISRCPNLEDIVSTKVSDDEENMENMFSKLQHLQLRRLPNLTKFWSRSCMEFPSLERQHLDNRNEIEEMDSKENLEDTIEHCLFDKKLRVPSLKRLLIDGLTKLITIWHNQISPESFKNLELVDIRSCGSLKNVFPSSLIRSLQQLMELNVVGCGVEVIIAREEGLQSPPKFVFSKVKNVKFNMLPQLGSFYPGMHASSWPSLDTLFVFGCNKVEIFAGDFSNFQGECESANHTPPIKQTLFLMEKDSFPNLKVLGTSGMDIWDGPFPAKFFSKLEFLQFGSPRSKSTTILEKFFDLEKLNATSTPSDQTSFHEGNSTGNISAVGILPHLRELRLGPMYNLMHLGEDNSQQARQNFLKLEIEILRLEWDIRLSNLRLHPGPMYNPMFLGKDNSQQACQSFPNLEILRLKYCHSLKNLRSSAISFKNLTTLQVNNCSALEYLITYSTAKSSMQLTKLEVENCARLTAIVGSNGDDSGNEIAFSRLKQLKLSHLPRMRGFCSGNCNVNFPLLETLSMSNRLKSKMFHQFHVAETLQITNERSDTDVDADDDEMITKENDEVDIGANGEHHDKIAQTANENEDTNVAETCSEMPPLPVLSSSREVQKAHLFAWKTVRLICVLVLVCLLMLVFGTYMRDLVV